MLNPARHATAHLWVWPHSYIQKTIDTTYGQNSSVKLELDKSDLLASSFPMWVDTYFSLNFNFLLQLLLPLISHSTEIDLKKNKYTTLIYSLSKTHSD